MSQTMTSKPSPLPRKYGRVVLTREQQQLCHRFVCGALLQEVETGFGTFPRYPGVTREQRDESYQSWARGGHAWNALGMGGSGIMAVLCWYQHIHRPGSKEWRPSIMIAALLQAAEAWASRAPGGVTP